MFAAIAIAPDFEIVIVIENVENRLMKIDCRGRERGHREINHNLCLKILFENRISRKNFILVEPQIENPCKLEKFAKGKEFRFVEIIYRSCRSNFSSITPLRNENER